MDNWSIMNRNIVVALLTLVALICVTTSDVYAQDATLKTAGKSVQTTSIGVIPLQSSANITDVKDVFEGDMITAQEHSRQGFIYAENGQYDLAISEFNKALKIAPSSPELYNNRGVVYSKARKYDLAISDFTKILELEPYSTQAYYNRGITYAVISQFKMAFLDLNKALEIDPLYKSAYDFRGNMYGVLACSDWQKACKLGDCKHFKKATTAGLCTEMNEDSN